MLEFLGGWIFGFGCGCYYVANKMEVEKPAATVADFIASDAVELKEKAVNGVQSVKEKFTGTPEVVAGEVK